MANITYKQIMYVPTYADLPTVADTGQIKTYNGSIWVTTPY